MKMTMVFLEGWRNSHAPRRVIYSLSQVQSRHLSDLVPKQSQDALCLIYPCLRRLDPQHRKVTYIREFLPFGLLQSCYLRLKLGSVLERRADIRLSYDFVSTFIFGLYLEMLDIS